MQNHTFILSLNSAAFQTTIGGETKLATGIRKGVCNNITKRGKVNSFGGTRVAGGEKAVNRCRIDNIGEKRQDEGRDTAFILKNCQEKSAQVVCLV